MVTITDWKGLEWISSSGFATSAWAMFRMIHPSTFYLLQCALCCLSLMPPCSFISPFLYFIMPWYCSSDPINLLPFHLLPPFIHFLNTSQISNSNHLFFLDFQMASTAFPHSVFSASSSSPRTCWGAASPSVFRTCPRSTSCPHCWAASWRVCRRCFQCLSKMFSSSTSSQTWTQRPERS